MYIYIYIHTQTYIFYFLNGVLWKAESKFEGVQLTLGFCVLLQMFSKTPYFALIFKTIFTGYKILHSQLLAFIILKISCH